MNVTRFLIASLAVFVTGVVLDYVIDAVILKGANEATKTSGAQTWHLKHGSFC